MTQVSLSTMSYKLDDIVLNITEYLLQLLFYYKTRQSNRKHGRRKGKFVNRVNYVISKYNIPRCLFSTWMRHI